MTHARLHLTTGGGLALAAVLLATTWPAAQSIDPAAFGDLHWRSIGPPRSGNVSAPAGVPGDATTYYIGLPEGGVWKTANAGTTWQPIFDQEHVPSVGAVTVAPSDHSVIYVGTGNQTGWSFTPGNGVYKSTDAGRTWTNVGLHDSQYIASIAVDPHDANIALVAALGARGAGGRGAPPVAPTEAGERGVYRTTDGGRTWARVLPSGQSAAASELVMDFANPKMIFALLTAAPGPAQESPSGLYRSSDEGATWQSATGHGLPPNARISTFTEASGTDGRRLYAVAGTGGRGAGSRILYRSDDGGDSWTLGTSQLASAGGKIYADPQHPDVLYLMGTAIYRSTDAGRHIAAFWGAPSGADPRFLWIDPTNASRMIAGVDQGASISIDGGQSWSPYYGIVNGQFYRVATDYDVPYHVCGPQQDSGTACVLSRSDFGEIRPQDWYTPGGFENGFLIADPLDHRYMWTQGWYHVLRRFDRTTNQVIVLYQPTAEDRFGSAPPLAFAPQDGKRLYMAAQHVLVSDDRGVNWRSISPDLTLGHEPPLPPNAPTGARSAGGAPGPAPGASIQAMALSPVTAGVIWTGSSNGVIQVTRDGGRSWTDVTPANLPPGAINIIDASHTNAGTAYAALLSRDNSPHVFRTSNYGTAWQDITNGLPAGAATRVIREDPRDPNIVYAGTVMAVWVSFDRGDHWQSLQLNLPNTVISDMTIHGSDLVISTYGRGFWILDNISPLRQARAVLAARAAAAFLTPEPASRARWDNTQDTPVPPEMIVGENPMEGAVLDYYLAAPASSVTLTIADKSGAVVREYSNVPPPADTTMANVPEYWLQPPIVLPTTPGVHRLAWDLRYPDPPTLNYGYSGTPLDYREYTLSWHAIPGHTPHSTLVGPMVLPGTYTATLTVDGHRYVQPVVVTQDPRIDVPAAGLAAQFHLEQRMVAGIAATFHGVTALQHLRAGLGAGSPDAATVDAALVALGLAHRDLSRRLNDQLVADFAPTPSVTAGVDEPCAAIDKAFASVKNVQGWTAPAVPACGGK